MPSRYFLRCLGSPELRGPGGEPVRFRTRKHLALLAFLAAERPDRHRRDRLADLLWPDARPSEGRHSLATALSVIRGKLGPRTFESSRDTVRLVAPDLEVDLERLSRGDVLGDEATPALEVAGFLEDFEVARAPEFMLWRDLMRARWFPQIRDALIVLMDRCRRTGDFTRIGAHADRLMALDELSEEAVRAKMEACAFQGDRISAIRVFQDWRQRLKQELDAEPTPLVEGMALRLRQRSVEPPGTSHVPTVPTDQWRNRAFVGRATQYRFLYERWEETNDRRGRHCLVLGDSGIGKTTLVERLTTAAGLEGAVSSRVQCYEVERELPYAAVGTLVRGLLLRPGASGTPPEWLAELARTTPAVAQRFPNLPPARDTSGENSRLLLTEAVHELAGAVAEEHPVILIVDDVHLADDASVAVLHLLMRRTQEQRIMVIMTARQAELGNSPHAGRLLEHREPLGLEAVELPPLTDEEMSEVVTVLAQTAACEMPPAVRRALLRASAGVPMIVELLFDDWRLNGEDGIALSIGAMTVDARGQEQRELYHRIFERTLRALSAEARAVLNLGAILGERLNDLRMYELVDLSLAQTLAGMAELAQHRVLRDGGREMEFRNELLRAYAYLSVPSPLRRALHGLIADRLLADESAGDPVPGLMLAWHCFRAGRPEKAEPYLISGSKESLRKGGTFEVELALTSAMPGLRPACAEEARLLLAEALQEQDRYAEALGLLEDIESTTQWVPRRKQLLCARSRAELATSPQEAEGILRTIESILAGTDRIGDRIIAIESAINPLYVLADRRAATRVLAVASELYPLSTDFEDRARIARTLAFTTWLTRQREKLPQLCSQLTSLAADCQSEGLASFSIWSLLTGLCCLQLGLGRYRDALPNCRSAYWVANRLGNDARMGGAAINMAICLTRLGEYIQQFEWTGRAQRHFKQSSSSWSKIQAAYYYALGACMVGENKKGITAIEEVDLVTLESRSAWILQASMLMVSDVLYLAGEKEVAQRRANEGLQRTGRTPLAHGFTGTAMRWIERTADSHASEASALALLESLCDEIEDYDLIDQAEILCARKRIGDRMGTKRADCSPMLAGVLSRLPPAVEVQLRRLGSLG
jgi:DNA-binding SARP family transcriptional activator/predicted ATPase